MIRFTDENQHSIYWYDAADVAKYLNIRDTATNRIVGRNKFLQLLRANGCLMRDSNQPTQHWIQLGLARWHMVTRRYKHYGMPIFSDKALAYIENKIKSGVWQIEFQKRIDKYKSVKLEDVC